MPRFKKKLSQIPLKVQFVLEGHLCHGV